MVEASTQLTAHEAELYDRQIRLWGVETQAKLRESSVLVIGMDGLGSEFVKNIVLAGVKSLTILDDKEVTEEDLKNQLFISEAHIGENRAQSSLVKVQKLNPLVSVNYENQLVSDILPDFFLNFDVIISCNQPMSFNLRLDSECHPRGKKFYACSLYGTFGYIFADLQHHFYNSEEVIATKNGNRTEMKRSSARYPTLKDALNQDLTSSEFSKLFRRQIPSFLLLKVLVQFFEEHGRNPTFSEDDYTSLLKIRDRLFQNTTFNDKTLPDSIFRCVIGLPNPCCAIVGAFAAQDVIRALSESALPLYNFFFFDPLTLGGHIQYLGPNFSQ